MATKDVEYFRYAYYVMKFISTTEMCLERTTKNSYPNDNSEITDIFHFSYAFNSPNFTFTNKESDIVTGGMLLNANTIEWNAFHVGGLHFKKN
ncbi:MAG: hypothetical protein LBB53_01750 [Prevotellaceae bacterium]|nr:hypothetical protein [Prevotellaceae bacterium]